MPAKKQIPKERIVRAATEILRTRGMGAVNARSIAAKLKCSTRPIYLSFKSMDEIKNVVTAEITKIYQSYLDFEVKNSAYPPYKAFGMGYIKFAREEKEFFKYLFMRDRSNEPKGIDGGDIEGVMSVLTNTTGLDRQTADRFHLEMWIYVHGIATMFATSYLELDEETVSGLISDAYLGIKTRYEI